MAKIRHRYTDTINGGRKLTGAGMDEYFGTGRSDRSFEDNVLAKYEYTEDLYATPKSKESQEQEDKGMFKSVAILYAIGLVLLLWYLL
jgi:hypothetical protein